MGGNEEQNMETSNDNYMGLYLRDAFEEEGGAAAPCSLLSGLIYSFSPSLKVDSKASFAIHHYQLHGQHYLASK
jgi:hypothetical protein